MLPASRGNLRIAARGSPHPTSKTSLSCPLPWSRAVTLPSLLFPMTRSWVEIRARSDARRLVILNLLYLLFIVVIPFSTSLISLYLGRLSVMVYAGLMACAGYMLTVLRIYAERNHRLISKKHSVQSIRGGVLVGLMMPMWFTISIGVAFFSSLVAQLSWMVALVAHIALVHRLRHRVLL
jgi:uncharacterized membrane protein